MYEKKILVFHCVRLGQPDWWLLPQISPVGLWDCGTGWPRLGAHAINVNEVTESGRTENFNSRGFIIIIIIIIIIIGTEFTKNLEQDGPAVQLPKQG